MGDNRDESDCRHSAFAVDATELLGGLPQDDRNLQGMDFSDVHAATTRKKIITVDSSTDQPWLEKLSPILDQPLRSSTTRTSRFIPLRETMRPADLLRASGWRDVQALRLGKLRMSRKIKVRLKAGFQASNQDMYREETILLQCKPK
jgi:hypothetical protein